MEKKKSHFFSGISRETLFIGFRTKSLVEERIQPACMYACMQSVIVRTYTYIAIELYKSRKEGVIFNGKTVSSSIHSEREWHGWLPG